MMKLFLKQVTIGNYVDVFDECVRIVLAIW